MLFGRPSKVELGSEKLEGYLREIFERDSERIVARCTKPRERLERGISMFKNAVDGLEAYGGAPDLESTGMTGESVVSDRKRRYVIALRNVLASLGKELEPEIHETSYEKLLHEKSVYERMISDVLRLNSDFKVVVLGYSERMGAFKKAFSELERGVRDMATELGRGAVSFDHYNTLKLHIENLVELKEEVGTISAFADSGGQAMCNNLGGETLREMEALESRSRELSTKENALSSKIRELSGNIESLLQPIERASRKYDHGKKENGKISHFTTNPYAVDWKGSEYARFIEIIRDLRNSILNKTIDVKNDEGIISRIDLIIDSRIGDMINEVRGIEMEMDEVRNEIRVCNSEIYMLKEHTTKKKAEGEEREKILKKAEDAKENVSEEKRAIERLFIEYYNALVSITD